MKLYDTGVYLQNGKEIIPAAEAQLPVSREDAARNTIAYSILKAHNTSGNMDKLCLLYTSCCFLQQELMDMACTTFPVIFFQALW